MNYNVSCTGINYRSCIAVPRTIHFARLAELCTGDIEVIEVLTTDRCYSKILVVSGYLDINDDTLSLEQLERCIDKAKGSRMPILFGLDTNAHSVLWNSPDTNGRGSKMEDFIMQHALVLHNKGKTPTFETTRSASIIDVTLTCNHLANHVENWYVNLDHQMSDHKRLEFELKLKISNKIAVRNFNRANWELFRQLLDKYKRTFYNNKWNKNVIEKETIDLEKDIVKALDVACPVRDVHQKNNRQPKWWSGGIR